MDDENQGPETKDMTIEDILQGGKESEYKLSKGVYTLQKSSFNVDKPSKNTHRKGNLPEVDDPDFWQKVLPFHGYTPKQLMRRFKMKKADICGSKHNQKVFMKDVQKVVRDLIEVKQYSESINVDEELIDLVKRITKTKNFENKFRDKAQVLLEELRELQQQKSDIIQDNLGEGGVPNPEKGGQQVN